MSRLLRAHLLLVRAGLREQTRYRLATFGGLVANVTFGVLKTAVLGAAVGASGGALAGYDEASMITYVWLTQGLLGAVHLMRPLALAERILSGDITVDFLRPLDVHSATLASEFGRSLYNLLVRGVPSLAVGIVAGMALTRSPVALGLGLVSVVIGVVVSAATAYLAAASGFWLVETRGVFFVSIVAGGFLAGLFVPIWLFPPWLQAIALATPFPSMMMFPTDIIGGRTTGVAAAGLVAVQCGWLVATVAAGQWVTRAGRRHLEVQGG